MRNELRFARNDVDPKQIEAARSGAARPNLQHEVMDATKLGFADGKFDIVASRMATHHIPNWQRALCEMIRVLRPGGHLIYSDFVFPLWLARVACFVRLLAFPSTNKLQLLAERAGLVPVYELHDFGKVDVIWRKNENGCEARTLS
jgi:SAM-dependent methyltransferase